MIEELKLEKLIKIYPLLIFILFLSFIIFYSLFQILNYKFIPEPGEKVYFPPGKNIKFLTDELERKKIISSSFYLRIYLLFIGKSKNIKAGYYEFKGNLNIPKVTEILIKGGSGIKITFPEGLTLIEINDILNKNGLNVDLSKFKLKDFQDIELLKYFPEDLKLEGFLAPDTYEFFSEETEKEIVKKFLNNFSKKFLPEFLKYPEVNFYDKLKLASILEKEGKFEDDMKIIAGILENRLKKNKKLEVDATVAYTKCKKYPCSWNVSSKDLKIKSEYNTYLNQGYPPTPISNPGIIAIRAALNPIKTDYFYYITKEDGQAVFAKNLKEHQQNIKKYLKK
jgi:UPF0755 protein